MLIDLIVGSAVLLFGLYLLAWCSSPALRDRIEAPKHDFMARVRLQARAHDVGHEEQNP